MVRRISSSRPMTGSSLPLRASAVRSRPYFSSAWNVSSGVWLVTRWLPRMDCKPRRRSSRVTFRRSVIASSRCSIERYSSDSAARSASARSRRSRSGRLTVDSPPCAFGSLAILSSTSRFSAAGATPTLVSSGNTMLSGWLSNAASRWSGVTSGLAEPRAAPTALLKASCVLRVHLFGSSAMTHLSWGGRTGHKT